MNRVPESPFWKAVRELAAMREHIPPERRALSGVRRAMQLDLLTRGDHRE